MLGKFFRNIAKMYMIGGSGVYKAAVAGSLNPFGPCLAQSDLGDARPWDKHSIASASSLLSLLTGANSCISSYCPYQLQKRFAAVTVHAFAARSIQAALLELIAQAVRLIDCGQEELQLMEK